ncbi:MAG: MATE family efflux transporter [Lachnospiraceae bacterium]|nr:MATE family efflux transporter [Lachnospiraceae bacterium]
MTKDMTQGSPMKLILGFTIPLLFGFLFQQCYSLVDTIIVGRFLGVDALAAVGSTGPLNFFIIGFCTGVCSGFSIPISHKFGAGDYVGLRKTVANTVWLSIIFSVVMTTVTVVACRMILILTKTPENIFEGAYEYFVIILLGIPVTYLYNLLSGIIRALGDSKTPVIFLTIAAVLNIFLDILFIVTFQMGIAGAAWATVLSQGIAGISCLFYMIKKFEILKIQKEEWAPDRHLMGILCNMGIPMGLQYSITAIGSVVLQTAVNTLGSGAVAAVTAASRVGMFMMCPFEAMGNTMATYGGQNVGAGRLDRLTQGVKSCLLIGFTYAAMAIGIVYFAGRYLIGMFVEASEVAIVDDAFIYLFINTIFYFGLAIVNIVRFMIQGMGFSKLAVLAGIFEMVARGIVGFALVPVFGFTAAAFGSPLAWIMADCFLIPAYIYCNKQLHKRMGKEC